MDVLRYYYTIKHLKPIQIIGRLRYRLFPPKPNLAPAPPLRRVSVAWSTPARRQACMQGPTHCHFLNEGHDIADPSDWNTPAMEKLWLYNLHYFDDLNAEGASTRIEWHKCLMAHWVDENPPVIGNGWEPYPTSLRIVNWLKWALAGNPLEQKWLHSLAVQTRWLAKRLEVHLLGNHLFANAKALVFAGLFFEGPEAEAWLEKGMEILAREIPGQVLADGGQFERSPMYHALALEDMLDLANVATAYADAIPVDRKGFVARWPETVGRMRHWLAVMCHPDGDISFFNDAALGIAPSPSELEDYARRLWPLRLNGAQGVLGANRLTAYVSDSLPSMDAGFRRPCRNDDKNLNSTAFGHVHLADSGYIRVTWGDMVALLDVAPVGPDYLPGHAHADTLSFELSLFGRRVLVNSGTSRYGIGPERSWQRGTAAHNTVAINGQDSSEVWGGFRVARRAKPFGLRIEEGENSLKVVCSHDGYRRLPGNPVHKREWRFSEGMLEIVDTIEGGFDEAVGRLFFHPGLSLKNPPCPPLQGGGGGISQGWEGLPSGHMEGIGENRLYWQVEGAESRITQTVYHPEFGIAEPNQCLEMRFSQPVCSVRLTWDGLNIKTL